MNCLRCGRANLREHRASLRGEFHGEQFVVSMDGLVCPKCGYATVAGDKMAEYMRLVADAYRSAHGLLTSVEIRKHRSRMGMSQIEFADYLGVGVASLKRWEMGKVQDPSSDQLIRLKTDEEAAMRNVERLRETANPWKKVNRLRLHAILQGPESRAVVARAAAPRLRTPVGWVSIPPPGGPR